MANPLSIYSGPAQVSLYDATNGLNLLGLVQDVELTGDPQQHELMDGNIHQYATLYKLKVPVTQSHSGLITDLKNRRGTKQEITLVGLESIVKMHNVFIVYRARRGYKSNEPHIVEVEAQTAIEDDVYLRENILAADGKFETDSNSDGFADGWVALAGATGSLVSSWLSGGGNAQQVNAATAADSGMYYDVLLPFEQQAKMTFSLYAKNTDTASQTIKTYFELLDASGTSIGVYEKSHSFAASEDKRISHALSVQPSVAVKTVRVGVKLPASVVFQFDNAQLEMGELTDFKAY